MVLSTVLVVNAPSAQAAEPCGTGSNPVICENSKPGTAPSVWDVDGSGDSSIQGFSTDISVNVGSNIDFKIDTRASAYSITIFRSGWYQGLGARQIATVAPSVALPQSQPQCISDATTEFYDCGTWKVSASWNVPTDAVSGVYFALLRRNDTGGTSHITFVVRDRASHSAVLFQTSDPTWQAYNTYGGSDFYQGAANGRAYKVSYNRPISTRADNSGRDFYYSNEYPTVRFLEKNGYDVTYASGVDTDRFGSDLLNHKVFLSVGHDEYWSGAQRANVEKARDAGVNLQFLSGNEAYWHTRYEASADGSNTAYRTLVSYKETWASAKIDPTATWTGTWRDPRFSTPANGGGLPENSLTGTMYMANHDDLPVTVSAAEGKLRLWRNTGLASQAVGTKTALAPHTVGYESNEDLDNGFRQSGLIRLSTTVGATPQYLQDFGTNVAPGTTTHNVTLYRAASGALVFSAASIQWAWGLDQEHDGNGAAADVRMQQAQVNLLADMGAQAGTLVAPLVAATASADATPPTVSVTSPTAGTAIANGTSVTMTGTAADVGGTVAGVNVSTDDGATWHRATGTTSWSYTYAQHGMGSQSVQIRAIDDSANYSATPASVTYTVGGPYSMFGAEVPAIPDSGDPTAVELGMKFSPTVDGYVAGVRFYKSAANTGAHTGSLWSAAGARLATVTFSGETASGWQTMRFATPVAVTAGATYTVSYNDPKGHYSAVNYYWAYGASSQGPLVAAVGSSLPINAGVYSTSGDFPTQDFGATNYFVDAVFESADNSVLVASNQTPAAGASSVPTGTTISAVFSRAVTASSVTFTVVNASGATVAGATSYAATTRTATFTPTQPLASFVKYTVTLAGSDAQGIALTTGSSWSFTTAQAAAVDGLCPCSLFDDAAVPTILQVTDSSAPTLGIRFTTLKSGFISGVKFYKATGNTGVHVGALWSSTGTSLATATFTNESSSGWQTVSFSSPVAVTAGTSYVASYRTAVGAYSATPGAYTNAGFTRGPLQVAADAGVYSYPDGFPGNTTSTDYGVDVVFKNSTASFTVVSQSPAPNAVSIDRNSSISATLSTPVADGYAMAVNSQGSAIAGTTALSSDRQTITFTPAATLPNGAVVNVALSGLVTTDGVTMSTQSWSFTTMNTTTSTISTMFGSETPATAAANDSSAVEVGVEFTPSVAGTVTAIRFYKGAGNTGTHKGHLWSSTGQLLATVTFTGETATGWQSANLSSPVTLTVGQAYVVSYLAPNGNYAATSNYFPAAVGNGPLAPSASNNGRYLYGSSGGFPTSSWQATNYFVDVNYAVTTSPDPT
ncbi:MAG: hypothetical protein QOK46_1368, partial [Microbacteriaceae bacterium]|nr:hypothetical protein [Microbacteriaceae bacterium]